MIMPFLRLVIIYIVVILAAVLFFKRDSVMSMLGMSSGGAEISAPADEPAKLAAPVAQTEAEPTTAPSSADATETAPQPDATQPPKYPTNETAQIVAPTAPAETAEATGASGDDDIQTRLNEARQAYWNRDLKGAEARYKGLINAAPDNADIKGELGNLYFAQRRMDEAATMYHQAGLQLIKDGNPQQVMGLIGVLQNIAPDKAADLRNRLSQ